jgi:hypothetical protein
MEKNCSQFNAFEEKSQKGPRHTATEECVEQTVIKTLRVCG